MLIACAGILSPVLCSTGICFGRFISMSTSVRITSPPSTFAASAIFSMYSYCSWLSVTLIIGIVHPHLVVSECVVKHEDAVDDDERPREPLCDLVAVAVDANHQPRGDCSESEFDGEERCVAVLDRDCHQRISLVAVMMAHSVPRADSVGDVEEEPECSYLLHYSISAKSGLP